MNVLARVLDKIDHFSDDRQKTLLINLAEPDVRNLDIDSKGGLVDLFDLIDANSSQDQKDWLVEIVNDIVYYSDSPVPPIFKVHNGENVTLDVELNEGQDFSAFNLTARRADNGDILSSDATKGDSYANDAVQQVYINDLDLPTGEFFKVHVLLEQRDAQGKANGNAVTMLDEVFIIPQEKIGTD